MANLKHGTHNKKEQWNKVRVVSWPMEMSLQWSLEIRTCILLIKLYRKSKILRASNAHMLLLLSRAQTGPFYGLRITRVARGTLPSAMLFVSYSPLARVLLFLVRVREEFRYGMRSITVSQSGHFMQVSIPQLSKNISRIYSFDDRECNSLIENSLVFVLRWSSPAIDNEGMLHVKRMQRTNICLGGI